MLIKWSILNDQPWISFANTLNSCERFKNRGQVCGVMSQRLPKHNMCSRLAFFRLRPNANTGEPPACFTGAALAEVTYWAPWVAEWGQTADVYRVIGKRVSEQSKSQLRARALAFQHLPFTVTAPMSELCRGILTLRFLCSGRSGWSGGLRPRFDGRLVVTWSGGRTFLDEPWRTEVVHWSTLVLQRGSREVCVEKKRRKTILGIDQK